MLGSWVRCGGDSDQFWHQTPRIIIAVIAANNEQHSENWKQAVTQAWLTDRLSRLKEPPELAEMLGDPVQEETDEQREAINDRNLKRWEAILVHSYGTAP
jgi:hypothetical protein